MRNLVVTSGLLILALAALRPLLRGNISPRIQYALWGIVALRLLLPVSLPDSAISVLNLMPKSSPMEQNIAVPAPYAPSPDEAVQTGGDTGLQWRDPLPAAREDTVPVLSYRMIRVVWLTGAALLGLWFLAVNLWFWRDAKRGRRRVETDCSLPVYRSSGVPTPCLLGLFRPAVYLTDAVAEEQMPHVLAHEMTHYRQRDHWWAVVRGVCLCVYWFDPLVWLAAVLSRRDCELSCDAGAVRLLGEESRTAYGRTLVQLSAEAPRSFSVLRTATTMAETENSLRERVQMIAKRPRTLAAAVVVTAAVILIAAAAAFTGAGPAEDNAVLPAAVEAGAEPRPVWPELLAEHLQTDSRVPPALRSAMDFPNVQSIREGGVLNVTTTVADRHCLYIAYDVRLSNLPDDIQSAAWDECSLTLKNPETGEYHPFSGAFGNLALKPRDGYLTGLFQYCFDQPMDAGTWRAEFHLRDPLYESVDGGQWELWHGEFEAVFDFSFADTTVEFPGDLPLNDGNAVLNVAEVSPLSVFCTVSGSLTVSQIKGPFPRFRDGSVLDWDAMTTREIPFGGSPRNAEPPYFVCDVGYALDRVIDPAEVECVIVNGVEVYPSAG